jgi:hypothetical protein
VNRAELLRAADLARAAADAATIAASFDRIKPDQAERFSRQSEEALYAALDALFLATLSPAAIREAKDQALSRRVEEAA